jgi:hypothetical protein
VITELNLLDHAGHHRDPPPHTIATQGAPHRGQIEARCRCALPTVDAGANSSVAAGTAA